MLSKAHVCCLVGRSSRLFATAVPVSSRASNVTKHKKHRKPTKNVTKQKNVWTFVSGFSKFATVDDIRQVLEANNEDIERILDESMLPSGACMVKSDAESVHAMVSRGKKAQHHLFGAFSSEEITDVEKYNTPSKFGIDDKTVLLYNVPQKVEIEDIGYVFEDIKLGKRGIQKLSSKKKYISSYLMFCATREDADLAVLRSDGMCMGGNHLHMFKYN